MPCSLTVRRLPCEPYHVSQGPASVSQPPCLSGCQAFDRVQATLTRGGRGWGTENEGREVDRLVQPARAANGFWLDTTTGAKWDDRFYEPKEGEA